MAASAFAPGYNVGRKEVEDYIRQSAAARGIDPEVALTVYKREGAGGWQSSVVKNGVRERSYGPFQLYIDGGLGNQFQRDTGLDPSNPDTWRQNVDYALDKAREGGWGPWYGARAAGITGFMGIDGQPVAAQALGGAPSSMAAAAAPSGGILGGGAPASPMGLLAGLSGQQQGQGVNPMLALGLLGGGQQEQPMQVPEVPVPLPKRPIDLTGLQALAQSRPRFGRAFSWG